MKKDECFILLTIFFCLPFYLGNADIIIEASDLNPKVGLVLSGGGARGISQIGVLRVLEDEKIPIDYISGVSIGALVGGLYALGYSPSELEEIALSTNWEELLSLKNEQERSEYFFDQKIIKDRTFLSFRFKNFNLIYPKAISLGWKFNSFLQKLIWKSGIYSENFDSLRIPFRAVATDIATGNSIVFDKGSIPVALRASSTLPLINTPIEEDTMVLVDGGLFANLPVDAISNFLPNIILCVNTTTPPLKRNELNKPWSIANQVVSILMNKFTLEAIKKVDILIQPDIGNHSNSDFTHLDSLVLAGKNSAREMLPTIKDKLAKARLQIIDSLQKIIAQKFRINDTLFVITSDNDSIYFLTTKQMISQTIGSQDNIISLANFLERISNDPSFKRLRIISNNQAFYSSLPQKILISIEYYPNFDKISFVNKLGKFDIEIDSIAKTFIGKPANQRNKKELIIKITKFLAEKGYAFSKVYFLDSLNNRSNIFTIQIHPNRIERIIFKNISANNLIVQRELTFKEGDFINPGQIAQSWSNLISTDLFSDLRIDFHLNPDNISSIITIEGKERGTQILNIPLRIDSERNLQSGLEFIQENLLNLGGRLVTSFLLGKRNLISKIEIAQSRILNTQFTFSLESFYKRNGNYVYDRVNNLPRNRFENQIINEIITENYGFSLKIGSQIERLGNFFVKLRTEKQRYYFKTEELKPNYYALNNIQIGLIYDSQDKIDFPTEGRYINVIFETPLNLPKGALNFSKAYFSHTNIFSFKDISIKPQVAFGFADLSTPFPEFFSLGGNESLLGFREDELRGRQIFSASMDARYRIPYKIYFDTFISLHYGIGSAWNQFETIKIADLKHSIGISVYFDTPIGPAKFSLGKGFYFLKNPSTIVWGTWQTYFSIGSKLF